MSMVCLLSKISVGNIRISVSYTHLDVYKRQELQVAMNFFRPNDENFSANIRILPTEILLNKQIIDIQPATVFYAKDSIVVNDFALSQEGMLLVGWGNCFEKS